MRGVIKGVLAEELKNSLRMKKNYEAALRQLPPGSLAKRVIGGRPYYYMVRRVGDKVRYDYAGKISESEKKKCENVKIARAKYRKLLSQVKKQIRFLRSALRGKEAV